MGDDIFLFSSNILGRPKLEVGKSDIIIHFVDILSEGYI
jgi:hypothetical protein